MVLVILDIADKGCVVHILKLRSESGAARGAEQVGGACARLCMLCADIHCERPAASCASPRMTTKGISAMVKAR